MPGFLSCSLHVQDCRSGDLPCICIFVWTSISCANTRNGPNHPSRQFFFGWNTISYICFSFCSSITLYQIAMLYRFSNSSGISIFLLSGIPSVSISSFLFSSNCFSRSFTCSFSCLSFSSRPSSFWCLLCFLSVLAMLLASLFSFSWAA